MTEHSRKRNRLSLSCSNCKKRKVKCDRGRPCVACSRYRTESTCSYPGQIWLAESDNSNHDDQFKNVPVMQSFLVEPKKSSISDGYLLANKTYTPVLTGSNKFSFRVDTPKEETTQKHVYSELEALRNKINMLESSLAREKSPGSTVTAESDVNMHPRVVQNPPSQLAQTDNVSPSPRWPSKGVAWSPMFESNIRNDSYSTRPNLLGFNRFDEDSPDESINFYEGYTLIHVRSDSKQLNHGPFSWMSLMKKDRALLKIWEYTVFRQSKAPLYSAPPPPRGLQEPAPENDFEARALDREGYNDTIPYSENKNKQINTLSSTAKSELNKGAMALGLTVFEGKIDQELHLIEKLRVILPKQKVIWILVNGFFTNMFPFIPLLDERRFKADLVEIIGPAHYNDGPVPSFNIEKRLDLATMGILLVTMRLCYLSNFSNRAQLNERILNSVDEANAELKYLLTNPIDIDAISFAQLCLDQFDLTRQPNLKVLQLAVMLRVYRMFAPEDGDGADGGDSYIYNALLTQMACSIGLNREPDLFPDVSNDGRTNNLLRRIWYHLRLKDIVQASQYGNPLAINEDFYDIQIPYTRPDNSCLIDSRLDATINDSVEMSDKVLKELKGILQKCMSIKTNIKLLELTRDISGFESLLSETFGKLSDYTKTPYDPKAYPFVKIKKCKAYINNKMFINTVYFYLFLHYEKLNKIDLTLFYLKKLLNVLYGEFVPEYLELLQNNNKHFDPASTVADLILNPSLEFMIHKGAQINFAILIRINHTIYKLKKNTTVHKANMFSNYAYKLHFAKICKLSRMTEKFTKFGINCLSRLSNRYYYSWRVAKAHSYIIELIAGEPFYETCDNLTEVLDFSQVSDEQLNELVDICEDTSRRVKDVIDADLKETQKLSDDPPLLERADSTSHIDSQFSENGQQDKASTTSSSIDLEEFNYKNNDEIDKLWLQMLNMKNTDQPSDFLKEDVEVSNFEDIMFTDQYFQQQGPFTPGTSIADMNNQLPF